MTSESEMASYLNVEINELKDILQDLLGHRKILKLGHQYIASDLMDRYQTVVVDLLDEYHTNYPIREGMQLEEFRSNFNYMEAKDRDAMLKYLDKKDVISLSENTVRLASFDPSLKDKHYKVKEDMDRLFKDYGFKPPKAYEVVEDDPVKEEILRSMVDHELVRLGKNIYIHRDSYEAGQQAVVDKIKEDGSITLAEFRDMMDTSRKYAMLTLESYDANGLTKRVGDKRILAK